MVGWLSEGSGKTGLLKAYADGLATKMLALLAWTASITFFHAATCSSEYIPGPCG